MVITSVLDKVIKAYFKLIIKFFELGNYDILVVGYPGQFDIFIARLLNIFRRKQVCWDVLMSIYLVSCERQLDQKSNVTVKLLKWIEKTACRTADLMILESQEYVDWFINTHNADPKKFRLVSLGALPPVSPVTIEQSVKKQSNKINVLYWGGFLRSHGIDCMVKAASLLQDEQNIHFDFVGSGPERKNILELANKMGLHNASFPGFLSSEELSKKIIDADICLGVFGSTQQSYMTIQNKIYECLSMGKPLISGKSPLVSRTFKQGQEIYMCGRNPEQLAEAIKLLSSSTSLRKNISNGGKSVYCANYTPQKIGFVFRNHLDNLILQNHKFAKKT